MKGEFWNTERETGSKKGIRGQSLKRAVKSLSVLAVVTLGFCSIVATGGGGGSDSSSSGSASALLLPDRIELSNTDDDSSTAASLSTAMIGAAVSGAFDDAGTDYTTQTVNTWVDDTDALDMVNDILGVCEETAYENFLNEGPYKALVSSVGESDTSQSGSSSSSTTTESLMEVTVDVSRESNNDPMIVKIWVEESDGPGDMPMLIRGYFEVTEGVSQQYPYGLMEAHFKGSALNNDGSEGDEVFTMAMSVGADDDGNVVIQFVETSDEGDFKWDNQARVIANSTVTTGNAYTYQREENPMDGTHESTCYFAFDEDYFKFTDDGGVSETVLDKNDFSYKIFRYKLFDNDTGDAVTRNSGYPIQLASGENSGKHAYIGYWGLWAPYGVEISDGDTVTRMGSDEEYTVVKIGGKLKEHTKAQIPLDDLDGVEMSYWLETDSKDYIITWDTATEKFKKIGERSPENGNITYYDVGNQTNINDMEEYEGAWCEALNSYLPLGRLFAGADTPNSGDTLNYHSEETINPATASDLTLYYWNFALDAPIDQNDIDGAAAAEQAYWGGDPTEKQYFFDASELVLKETDENGDEVIMGFDLDLSDSFYEWGYHMSPLTTNGDYTKDDWWQAHDEDTYYSWETGQNDWNQFATLEDSYGDYVTFQAPLMLDYTHSTANDINDDATHDGVKFKLDYDGFELHIPWEFNPDATDGHEWEPMFGLKDGTTLTDSNNNEYVVKGIERALIMNEVGDPSVADALVIDTTIAPPTLEYDATKTALVGDRPEDAELKVNKGEIL